jgi:hypothetical protein
MILNLTEIIVSSIIIGAMAYMIVWSLHNFELTADTIMPWADRQETFLQKMISCPICLSVQASVALSSLHSLAFGIGLWRWAIICVLSCFMALWLTRSVDPLDKVKE